MGKKRKHSRDDYEHMAKKIRKLERKLLRSRKRRESSSPNPSEHSIRSPIDLEDGEYAESVPSILVEEVITQPSITTDDVTVPVINNEPIPSTSADVPVEPLTNELAPPTSDLAAAAVPVDDEIWKLLGDDPSVTKTYGKEINPDLAIRLQHIATNGISSDLRKELQEKYLPPSNCALIDAPSLNPEIKAAISEPVLKRDKGIEVKQKQLGCAISSIGEAISILLSVEDRNFAVVKLLMDASRLICDCQNIDSTTRRNFILYNLKKDLKDQLQKTKIDNFLFGSDLADTIKVAKSISKSGAELKNTTVTNKPPANKNKSQPTSTPRRNLNWKAPPPSRRQKGTTRTKEPAPSHHRAYSSKTSYRAPQTSRSRR